MVREPVINYEFLRGPACLLAQMRAAFPYQAFTLADAETLFTRATTAPVCLRADCGLASVAVYEQTGVRIFRFSPAGPVHGEVAPDPLYVRFDQGRDGFAPVMATGKMGKAWEGMIPQARAA